MKFEKLVQNLDAAAPWTVERIESVFGSRSIPARSSNTFVIHTMGPFLYDEKLIVEEVHLRLQTGTNEIIRFIVNLSEKASGFTLDKIKRTWPDIRLDPSAYPRGQSWDEKRHYQTNRPWGRISFGFKERHPNRLSSVTFIPRGKE